jgi:NAD+ diphosphatase
MCFPRLSPAIIVRITKGELILLARNHRFPTGRFSVLAGFVEPGETLEEAVAREVREEVGIRVRNIRYFDSQPWPFPNSLMLGFTAEYAEGELVIQEDELDEAHWFGRDELPDLPPAISIARRLIDDFVGNQQ